MLRSCVACRSRGWDPDENRLRVRYAVSELVVYVADQFGHFKYRPYEAPLIFPVLYPYLARSVLALV